MHTWVHTYFKKNTRREFFGSVSFFSHMCTQIQRENIRRIFGKFCVKIPHMCAQICAVVARKNIPYFCVSFAHICVHRIAAGRFVAMRVTSVSFFHTVCTQNNDRALRYNIGHFCVHTV